MKRTVSLLSELQDLKRLRPAGIRYSLADTLFVGTWRDVIAGAEWSEIADRTSCLAVLYVLFPGVDGRFFAAAGMEEDAIREVCTNAFERTVGDRLDTITTERLRRQLNGIVSDWARTQVPSSTGTESAPPAPKGRGNPLPDCLEKLRQQPRAGATHPEHPRLVLTPPESHADHSLLTAVYAALSAEAYGADAGSAFVCGLAHHLHNAFLPDCGWAGELALEPYLQQVIDNCRAAALEEFEPKLRARIRDVLRHHESIATPEGKAISTGDTIDRVLDVKWRVAAAAVTEAKVLGDLDLVHPGPLKDFQTELLHKTGLWSTP